MTKLNSYIKLVDVFFTLLNYRMSKKKFYRNQKRVVIYFLLIKLIFVLQALVVVGCMHEPGERSLLQVNKVAINLERTKAKAKEAKQYCKSNQFNSEFCILIDMSLHSGLNRFVVWDFKKDTIMHSILVGHGCCNNSWSEDESKESPDFSNVDGSHCSALGKYKIGERGYSSWGVNVKYALHGLDASNSNAFKRLIVFHSWELVSDSETFPDGTPEGWGCPTISDNNFKLIDPLLRNSAKPVLMWIYK